MVKGISRQVIVVHAPEPKLFEQAIFILRDGALGAEGVTEDKLMQEANRLLHRKRTPAAARGPLWACGGAALTGIVWMLTALL